MAMKNPKIPAYFKITAKLDNHIAISIEHRAAITIIARWMKKNFQVRVWLLSFLKTEVKMLLTIVITTRGNTKQTSRLGNRMM